MCCFSPSLFRHGSWEWWEVKDTTAALTCLASWESWCSESVLEENSLGESLFLKLEHRAVPTLYRTSWDPGVSWRSTARLWGKFIPRPLDLLPIEILLWQSSSLMVKVMASAQRLCKCDWWWTYRACLEGQETWNVAFLRQALLMAWLYYIGPTKSPSGVRLWLLPCCV